MHDYMALRNVTPEMCQEAHVPCWINPWLPKDRGDLVIDIGCGFGQLLRVLKNAGFRQLAGFDMNQVSIDYVRQQGIECHNNADDPFCAKLLDKLPGKAKLIVMHHVLDMCENMICSRL